VHQVGEVPANMATGDAQVYINPDFRGTRTDCRRSGIRPLALWADEVLQHPHPEASKASSGWCIILEVPGWSARAPSPDCDFATGGLERYVKLVVHPSAISASPWHRLLRIPHDKTLRSFKVWLPFLELSSQRLKAEKCTGESCWCT
jgi:hypothetical protein